MNEYVDNFSEVLQVPQKISGSQLASSSFSSNIPQGSEAR